MATDTVTPILVEDYRKEIGPKVWHWDQIYFGPDVTKYDKKDILRRYVPVVGDLVLHPTNGDWIVAEVSENMIPTLTPRHIVDNDIDVNDSIVVPSSAYSRRADVMHVDNTVTPIRFYINSRIFINGSHASHYKVFLGTNVGPSGNSIGAVYNASGKIVSDNIELELAAFDRDVTNLTIKTPKSGYLRELPADGELVTIVAYAQDGRQHDSQVLVVSHENFLSSGAATRFISSIALDTPYLSDADNSLIEIPRNMNLNALAMFGVVTYNDGTPSQRLPVNGTKFSLHGAEAFTASIDMNSVGVVLAYSLGDDESAVDTTGQVTRSKTKSYRIKTLPSDAAYSVKLFVIPVWNSQIAKWQLRYMLYDMRRDMRRDVTDIVEQSTETKFRFNPDQFNQKQTVKVSINLANVGPEYKFYRPTQSFYITLLKPGETPNQAAYYLLSYSSDIVIGNNLIAQRRRVNGLTTLDLSCGQASLEDYLMNVYKNIEVLYTPDVAAPPNPTKFRLRLYGTTVVQEFTIDKIVSGVSNVIGTWNQGQTAIVEFFAESGGQPVELGTLAYPINVVS